MCKILSARLLPSVNLDGPLSFMVEVHPEGESPLYIMSYYRGSYVFARDQLHARRYSYRTAKAHMANLLQRGDSKPVKNAVYFDREPIDTTVTFGYNKDNKTEEDLTMKMTVDQYVTHCIQHTEGYPEIGEISLESAELAVWNRYPDPSLPKMTAEEFRDAWNRLVKDPAVMGLYDEAAPDAKELSLDNGRSFLTRDDIEAEGLDAILAAHPAITWDAITNAMDDETREAVAAELAPCSEEEFLLRYLELAPANLVIG